MRVLTSSVLIMEAIVLLLAIPVAVVGEPDQPAWVGWLFAALALACALLPGMFRRPFFVPAGWLLQALVFASGLLIGWMMVVLGAVFTALWWTALHLGRKAEATQTAN